MIPILILAGLTLTLIAAYRVREHLIYRKHHMEIGARLSELARSDYNGNQFTGE